MRETRLLRGLRGDLRELLEVLEFVLESKGAKVELVESYPGQYTIRVDVEGREALLNLKSERRGVICVAESQPSGDGVPEALRIAELALGTAEMLLRAEERGVLHRRKVSKSPAELVEEDFRLQEEILELKAIYKERKRELEAAKRRELSEIEARIRDPGEREFAKRRLEARYRRMELELQAWYREEKAKVYSRRRRVALKLARVRRAVLRAS